MAKGKTTEGFSAEERAAIKAAVTEKRNAAKRGTGAKKAAADAADEQAAIAAMTGTDRQIGEALHAVVAEHAPQLLPKTWYGMPAYHRDGKVVVFFKCSAKFKMRYAEVGFNEAAQLDDGDLWPTAYGVTAVNDDVRRRLVELVTRAAG